MKLVIVESPAKAKTINKYLGKDYKVIASFGHIRDLPSKNGSVLPDEQFKMKYEISIKSKKYVTEILKAAKDADEVYLATDPDREGESISWHIAEVLKEKKIIKDYSKFKRVAFNEITKKAVLHAVNNPRTIDENLVNAQQARRALDYLVGFTISPILWRKLPGSKSAGRVQSVALKMICEREEEIENFKTQEYWDISFDMTNEADQAFISKLTLVDGDKLEKFSLKNNSDAETIENRLKGQNFTISEITKREQKRNAAPPFITSSLQQEASRKLGFSTKKTMQLAQKLYEGIEINGETVGLITYMRTDGVSLSNDAVSEIRNLINDKYGDKYLPSSPKIYKSKSKNAQEAHEAIRPTNINLTPEACNNLDRDQARLYELIWKRTMACQMESVVLDLVKADLLSDDKCFQAKANGSTISFDGFYKVYKEGKDDAEEDNNNALPPLKKGENIDVKKIRPEQHFTEPPPRFTEASLVKRMEELSIGRPSTYSSIISVLQERNYVTLEKKRFFASDLGRLVTAFMIGFFEKYVEYGFTAELEEDLDKVAEGTKGWIELLDNFWKGFIQNVSVVSDKDISEVIGYVEGRLDTYIFGDSSSDEYEKNKKCSSCTDGTLSLKLGKYGAFLACNNYPDCTYKRQITKDGSSADAIISPEDNTREIGTDTETGEMIYLKKGPYGWYLQLGEVKSKKEKPKRSPIPAGIKLEEIDLNLANRLLKLPLHIGVHPETKEDITMGIGKFGPYVKYQNKFTSIPKDLDPFNLSVEKAVEIIANRSTKRRGE